jgi:hypothetical protein
VLAAPAVGVVSGFVTLQIKSRILRSFETVEERNRISRTFSEYVSPAVMKTLLALKPDLRSEKRNVCVMFLDIRNFTSFSETRARWSIHLDIGRLTVVNFKFEKLRLNFARTGLKHKGLWA